MGVALCDTHSCLRRLAGVTAGRCASRTSVMLDGWWFGCRAGAGIRISVARNAPTVSIRHLQGSSESRVEGPIDV